MAAMARTASLQGLLDALHVPYTGSGVLGTALSLDKIRTEQAWASINLPTPRWRVSRTDDVLAAARELDLPVILNPSWKGRARTQSGFNAPTQQAVALAARYMGELLMEQLIEGDEFTVGILRRPGSADIHIVPAGEYYDYHAKYVAEDTQYICPGLDGQAEAGHARARARSVSHGRAAAAGDGSTSCATATVRTSCWKRIPRRA